jgi:hypothetical protein
MDIKELLIGSWVFDSEKNTPVQITDNTIDGSNIEPILITKEILNDNGFKEDKNTMYYDFVVNDHETWSVIVGFYEKCNLLIIKTSLGEMKHPFNYVHELQTALKLFNIEKEIVLATDQEVSKPNKVRDEIKLIVADYILNKDKGFTIDEAVNKHYSRILKFLREDFKEDLEEAWEKGNDVGYEDGKADANMVLPRWKKNPYGEFPDDDDLEELQNREDFRYTSTMFLYKGYMIEIDEVFNKLPKEE